MSRPCIERSISGPGASTSPPPSPPSQQESKHGPEHQLPRARAAAPHRCLGLSPDGDDRWHSSSRGRGCRRDRHGIRLRRRGGGGGAAPVPPDGTGCRAHRRRPPAISPSTRTRTLACLEGHLETLRLAAERAGVPIIASLNGATHEGWIDFARQIGAGRRRRHRAQRLPRARRSDGDRRGRRAGLSRHPAGREAAGRYPRLGQARPLLQLTRQHGAAARWRQAPTAWCCSVASTSRTSISGRSLRSGTCSSVHPDEMRLALMWTALLSDKLDASLAASSGVDDLRGGRSSFCWSAPMW